MRRHLFQRLLIAGLLAICVIGCQSAKSSKITNAGTCQSCTVGLAGGTIWCNQCNAGFVQGKKTICRSCYLAGVGGQKCKTCTTTK